MLGSPGRSGRAVRRRPRSRGRARVRRRPRGRPARHRPACWWSSVFSFGRCADSRQGLRRPGWPVLGRPSDRMESSSRSRMQAGSFLRSAAEIMSPSAVTEPPPSSAATRRARTSRRWRRPASGSSTGRSTVRPAPASARTSPAPEPDLVRARRHGQRTAGLDADARPRRSRPGLGTQTAPAAPVFRRRAPGLWRPPAAVAPRRDLALGGPAHHRDHPLASPRSRLTRQNRPCKQERKPAGPWNPAHPARQPGSQNRRPFGCGHGSSTY